MGAYSEDVSVGSEIPSYTKVAYQRALMEYEFATDSSHHPEYAKSKGYAGALVSGIVLCAYMSEMLLGFFGPEWMRGGKFSASFISPGVQLGDKVTCHGKVLESTKMETGTVIKLDIWMEKNEGVKVMVGEASGILKV
jgi:acyl dehydratase